MATRGGAMAMLKNQYGENRAARTQQELNVILTSHARYLTYQGGTRAQLARCNLDGLNLANRNLAEADFSGASLVGANLSGSSLERANLYCADLRQCNLQSAKMSHADMRGASFSGAKLTYAILDAADLRAAMMTFIGADRVPVIDAGSAKARGKIVTASGVDFSNCSMKCASLGNAQLDGANFTGALLQGATFKNAKLTNVTFKNADLTGVNLSDLAVPPEALDGCVQDVTPQAAAKLDSLKAMLEAHQQAITTGGAQGARAILDDEDLRPLRELLIARALTGLSARRACAIGIDFSGCQLQGANFEGADLRDANFSNADMRGVSLRGAKLAHAKFDKTNLGSLMLTGGTVLATDLGAVDANEDQFRRAILDSGSSAHGSVATKDTSAALA